MLRYDVFEIAAEHSRRMAASGELAHNDAYFSPEVRSRLQAKTLGENVAMNRSVEDAHRRLMASPGHQANLMNPKFTVVGMAIARTVDGMGFITQNFVEPAAASVVAAPAPPPPARALSVPPPAPASPPEPAPELAAAPAPPASAPAAPPPVSIAPAEPSPVDAAAREATATAIAADLERGRDAVRVASTVPLSRSASAPPLRARNELAAGDLAINPTPDDSGRRVLVALAAVLAGVIAGGVTVVLRQRRRRVRSA